jgi:hypothetical protein
VIPLLRQIDAANHIPMCTHATMPIAGYGLMTIKYVTGTVSIVASMTNAYGFSRAIRVHWLA